MRRLHILKQLLILIFAGLIAAPSFAPVFAHPAMPFAQVAVAVSIRTAPPVIPVYEQPPCPVDGYLWTPGYWGYGPAGYYWVPGVWVAPPRVGVLWTPGYWGFGGGLYAWHPGYWGPHVGFYGGINYGFGYFGAGFAGGVWAGGFFRYNTAVWAANAGVVRNVYVDRTVIHNTTVINRTSFNGEGGIRAEANEQERAAMREQHEGATGNQLSHERAMGADRNQWASNNGGRPGTMAMDRVDGRRFNQQGRIANGISSGRLTAGETRNLETKEAGLNKEIHQDRAANGGHLTGAERQQVNGQQNQLSKQIYNDKHNANNAKYGNNEVGARRDLQQQRIANGVASGQMSASEAANAEKTEQKINKQDFTDRKANGGPLTPAEKKSINQQQNKASRQIYNEKHNAKTAPTGTRGGAGKAGGGKEGGGRRGE